MRWIGRFMLVVAIMLSIAFFKFNFSDQIKAIMISLIGGIFVFDLIILISKITSLDIRKKKKKTKEEKMRKKKKVYFIAFIFMVISMPIFFNFYLYFKALMGNDLLISLDVENQNFILKNGGEQEINTKARILINPFCSANCSLILKDLTEDNVLEHENMYIGVSSPFSKQYIIHSDEEKSGQKLYKLTLECNTIKEQKFCYVNNDLPKLRTKIISVNYELNDNQAIKKDSLKNQTEDINRKFDTEKNTLDNFNFNSSYLDFSELEYKSNPLKEISNYLSLTLEELNNLYEEQEYSALENQISGVNEKINEWANLVEELNASFSGNITACNSIIDNLSSMREDILLLEEYNLSNSSKLIIESFIGKFNSMVKKMEKKDTLENKLLLFNELEAEKESILFSFQNGISEEIFGYEKIETPISQVEINKIKINYGNYSSDFNLAEPSPICCLKNECYKCVDDSSLNYPVVFVHGHSFNEKISVESSMDSFGEMAGKLEKDGYIDAGYFYGSQYDETAKGYLGKVNSSITIEATYYMDTQITEEGSFILDSKWESIETYSSRLNEIISNVKYLTGKDKVIIVAHSMGCLVTRKYIQMYGEDSLDKIVLVGGPNHGIDGFILKSCPIFGADIECNEMNTNNSFMVKLNEAPLPNIPVYNIIGNGCLIEGFEGDGIVKSESAYLDGAENIYVEGTCTGVDFFHVSMIQPSRHPEIYEIIKEKIKN
jgi:uncharacterized alpha/beta hydrolase family protein